MSTTVLPASELAGASLPGTGTTKRSLAPDMSATRAEDAAAAAAPRADEVGGAPAGPGAPDGPGAADEGGAASAGGGTPLRLTRAAHAAFRMQCAVNVEASSSPSSPTPQSTTLDMERRAAVKRLASAHVSGSGRPSQTLDGTRQHSSRTQPP